jgi:hypothetical protein
MLGATNQEGALWRGLKIIGPKCQDLVEELMGYSWDPKAQMKGEDKPIKKADHGPDALRYGLLSDAANNFDVSQTGWR